jgi:hypothetical protein
MLQERIKKTYPSVTLPISYSEEDRGFKRCCERRLVLASISSSEKFKNDVNSAWIKLADVIDTYEFQLVDHDGNPTIYVPVPAPIPNEPNAYYTTIEWRDVLLSDGIGCYTIKIVANIGGIVVDLVWGEYELKPYTIENANGTARISCKFGLQQQLEGINFADSQVRDDLRFNGQIEKGNPNMQIDSLIYNNRRIETVVNENLQEWILRTDPYTDEILRLFTELYLLSANEIFLSDYNAHTSTYRIRDIEATVEESPEKTKSGDTTRFQSLSCTLSDRVKDVRSMYGGQGVGSGANSPSTPAPFCLASSYTVAYAGGGVISAGTIPSGQSEAIIIPDCPSGGDADLTLNTGAFLTVASGSTTDISLVDQSDVDIVPISVIGSVIKVNIPTGGVDLDIVNFLTATGITDTTIESAITNLVTDLKSNYFWNRLYTIYPFVGGTASTHKFNLKDPRDLDEAFRIDFNGSWTHNANGITGDGTTSHADTNLNGQFNCTVYNECIGVYTRDTISNCLIGLASSPTDQIIQLGGTLYSSLSGGNANGAVTATNGLYTVNRLNTTGCQTYVNGGVVLSVTDAIVGYGNFNLNYYIGARNNGGGVDFRSSNNIAFSFIGKGFTALEQATLSTIIQDFQTELGR